jgi:hypothetical protein
MVSFIIAKQLKAAGLLWQPMLHDFFAIPDRDLDEQIFVINDMTAYVELIRGWPIVTFHGSSEWALDYIYLQELVWMLTESQARDELQQRLNDSPQPLVQLTGQANEYRCEIQFRGQGLAFMAAKASDAYAGALLYILQHSYGLNGLAQG